MKNTMLVLVVFFIMVIGSCTDSDKCYIYVTDDRIEVPCN